MNFFSLRISLLFAALLLFSACIDDEDDLEVAAADLSFDDNSFEPTDWTAATHSKEVDPNFDLVFRDDVVQRLDVVVDPERWQTMLDNMTDLYGAFGTGGGNGFLDENPVFVPAEVYHDGIEWYRVGIRFKGNSSLVSTWRRGNLKLSFKLDFDEFEDEYTQIDDQRFYGFKKLSLKNNYDDKSMLREKVAADIFRAAGLASSHTAFYTLYVDHGEGPIYFGLYTLVEEVDDTVIDTQFSDNDGNLYQPDGDGASFAAGTFSESVFEKETNEEEADWSDVQALFTALHDDLRTTDTEAWRTNLEDVFDTDAFLKYLAVNTVIQNWDTYGRMTHNYFLYNNPETNLLTWISWDNNEALQTGKRGGSLPLNFDGLDADEWPLIGFLYADEVYRAQYDAYVQETVNGVFSPSLMQDTYTTYADLIRPYATTEQEGYTFLISSAEFQSAVDELMNHVTQRAASVTSYME